VTDEPELSIPILKVGADAEASQRTSMAKLRAARDNASCEEALARLRTAAKGTENVFPFILECARRYCTLYEIRAAMEEVFGAYREPVFF
jgi:methylmalonyl-CoA mutase N-terminal domain/subunit